jgi:hypothetical protein
MRPRGAAAVRDGVRGREGERQKQLEPSRKAEGRFEDWARVCSMGHIGAWRMGKECAAWRAREAGGPRSRRRPPQRQRAGHEGQGSGDEVGRPPGPRAQRQGAQRSARGSQPASRRCGSSERHAVCAKQPSQQRRASAVGWKRGVGCGAGCGRAPGRPWAVQCLRAGLAYRADSSMSCPPRSTCTQGAKQRAMVPQLRRQCDTRGTWHT